MKVMLALVVASICAMTHAHAKELTPLVFKNGIVDRECVLENANGQVILSVAFIVDKQRVPVFLTGFGKMSGRKFTKEWRSAAFGSNSFVTLVQKEPFLEYKGGFDVGKGPIGTLTVLHNRETIVMKAREVCYGLD